MHWIVNPMTDEHYCTATLGTRYNIEISDGFYLSFAGRGGVGGITLRYGTEPAEKLRLPTRDEKSISAVILKDDAFSHLLASSRLRVQVLTVLDDLLYEDIDLTGAQEAYAYMKSSKCLPKRLSASQNSTTKPNRKRFATSRAAHCEANRARATQTENHEQYGQSSQPLYLRALEAPRASRKIARPFTLLAS